MAGDEFCQICRRQGRGEITGEVRYGTAWLCLPCHIMKLQLKQIPGKASVVRILQQCSGRCGDYSAVAGDCANTPAVFCLDGHQYLCKLCDQDVHREPRNHVSQS